MLLVAVFQAERREVLETPEGGRSREGSLGGSCRGGEGELES